MPTPRPNPRDPAIREAAANLLWPELLRWAPDLLEDDRLSLVKILRRAHDLDGFQLARDLESESWAMDAEAVNILDGASMKLHEAHRQVVAAWVRAEIIVAPFRPGDAVRIGSNGYFSESFKPSGPLVSGIVVRIDHDLAQVLVRVPSLGHVAEGQIGTQGSILPFEAVLPAEPEAPALEVPAP